ncbi:4'-phosphopantetheinyl transferase family protein [Maribacter thermophilus]|uniref:4'-phosphopantetheinyl transferase family protein n=1 Tax=Maribacter thermophilus TaxID=1197874 RepID=UPI000640EBB8|nr:4'-phosphopantetheinyl transferase superfamily protein [Maribacter thermophilus]
MIQKTKSRLFCGTVETPIDITTTISENKSEIKLFKIKLSDFYDRSPDLEIYLDKVELQRSQKYHFKKDRNRFIICRSFLKLLLAEYTKLDISQIHIDIHQNKKPYLRSHPSVFFNVSHTNDYGLIAIGNNAVGIDVEKIDRENDFTETIPYIFNKNEVLALESATDKQKLFYKFWTRKEAIVKATGKGIEDDFRQIPSSEGHHLVTSQLLADITDLTVLSFDINEEYIGAVAYEGNHEDIVSLQFSPLPSISSF